MSDDKPLEAEIRDRQVTMFAAFVGPGLHISRAALARASKIGESSLRDYAAGAAIPFYAVMNLSRFLPPEAINLMAEPAQRRIVAAQAAETNWDALAAGAAVLVAEVCEARKDGTIDHVEAARLKTRTRALIAEAQDAVSDG